MSLPTYQVRRATVEDLDALKALWSSMNFPAADLKNRLTEFQVATDALGTLLGAVGFRIHQRHGLIHSEAFPDFSVADAVRPLLWGRIQALAMNHGLVRFWTRENAPFWSHNGLQPADADALERLPEVWDRNAHGWLTLRLKDEDVLVSLDREFALFKEAEKQNTARTLGHAQKLKSFLMIVGLLACLAALAWVAYMVFMRSQRPPAGSNGGEFIRMVGTAHQGPAGHMRETQRPS